MKQVKSHDHIMIFKYTVNNLTINLGITKIETS